MRLVLIIALVAAVVAIPLVTVYRSKCEGQSARYEFVAPWDDPPAGCRNRSGLDVLRSELGLD